VTFSVLRHALTLAVVLAAWVFFRAPSLTDALTYLQNMFGSQGTDPRLFSNYLRYPIIVLVMEWLFRHRSHVLDMPFLTRVCRWAVYYVVIWYIFKAGNFQYVPFIYFQF
jgi:hypothetical protein